MNRSFRRGSIRRGKVTRCSRTCLISGDFSEHAGSLTVGGLQGEGHLDAVLRVIHVHDAEEQVVRLEHHLHERVGDEPSGVLHT